MMSKQITFTAFNSMIGRMFPRRRSNIGGVLAVMVSACLLGCPAEPENRAVMAQPQEQPIVQPGNWMFVMFGKDGDVFFVGGLKLLEDGTTDRYVIGNGMVSDAKEWWQDGNLFYLDREVGPAYIRHVADVTTPTQVAGRTFEMHRNVEEGSFIAVRIDDRL